MQLGDGQLSRRIITAVVGVPILLGLYYVGGWPLFFLLVGLIVIAADELGQMFDKLSVAPSRADLIFGGLTLLLGAYISTINKEYGTVGGAVVTVLFAAFAIKEMVKGTKFSPERVALALFGSIYVGLFSYLWLLRAFGEGSRYLITLVLLIWAQDIGAYFIGLTLGKRPLAPTISPKKTWEGALGGLACGVLVAGLVGLFWHMGGIGFLLGLVAGIAGQIGDLVESALKRAAGVKDSGSLLPGHGGVLDRFDSLIFAAPLAYLLVTVLLG